MLVTLLTFIDFVYAAAFALVVAEAYSRVVIPMMAAFPQGGWKSVAAQLPHLILLLGLFYFLTCEWIVGRLLTIQNPYLRYPRFFLELVIAGLTYGAAIMAINNNAVFLVFFGLILLIGVAWASCTKREHPTTADIVELRMIGITQTVFGLLAIGIYVYHRINNGPLITPALSVLFLIGCWVFVLAYEITVPRQAGVFGGPGVLCIPRRLLDSIRNRSHN